MLLNVQERLVLQNVLPAQGNFVTLKLLRELHGALAFSEEDIEKFKIVINGAKITWDPEATGENEIDIGPTMQGLIVEALQKLDGANQLTPAHLTLYEKFVKPAQTPQ